MNRAVLGHVVCALVSVAVLATGVRAETLEDLTIHASQPLQGETPVARAGDWPWWRGPASDGHSTDSNVPTTWSKTEHVLWKAPIPGRGHSSPIVCGDRVFVTTTDEDAKQQLLLCYDRKSGSELWKCVVHEGGLMHVQEKNSYSSATPAFDGTAVYTTFINHDALWVSAVDRDGKILWQKQAGPFQTEHGDGPSPVLYKSAVIVNGDNRDKSYIAALDRKTGELIWCTPREGAGRHANYASPILATVAGKPQILLHGHTRTASYDPDTGELLWSVVGPAEVAADTMAFSPELVFASGGFPEHEILAIKPDGAGDVTDSRIAWRTKRGATYVPSPLYYDQRLYVVNDQGVANCFDAMTGSPLWQKRLGGSFFASPVVAGDKIFVTSEAGVTFVFKAGSEYEAIASNDLGSNVFASPVICGGQIFLRAADGLYCIAE